MIKIFQKVGLFYVSKFESAVNAMQESCKEPWAEKVSNQEKNQLWALYKQATEGDKTHSQMTTESGKYPNMGSPMTSFRAMEGKQTAQGATEGDILKQQLTSEKNMSGSKTYFDQNAQKTGKEEISQKQKIEKGASSHLYQTKSSNPQKISQEGYGNRTGQQPGSQQSCSQKMQKKGLDTRSPEEKQRNTMWNKFEGKSKQEAQDEYIKLAKSILERNKADKYLKDL